MEGEQRRAQPVANGVAPHNARREAERRELCEQIDASRTAIRHLPPPLSSTLASMHGEQESQTLGGLLPGKTRPPEGSCNNRQNQQPKSVRQGSKRTCAVRSAGSGRASGAGSDSDPLQSSEDSSHRRHEAETGMRKRLSTMPAETTDQAFRGRPPRVERRDSGIANDEGQQRVEDQARPALTTANAMSVPAISSTPSSKQARQTVRERHQQRQRKAVHTLRLSGVVSGTTQMPLSFRP